MSGAWCRAHVALGSNLGLRAALLETALCELDALSGLRVEAVSSFHRTKPVGGPPGQGDYLNAVARVRTQLSPEALLDALLEIEARHGRDRANEPRNGPRTLDLDLLRMDDRTRSTPQLELPHPRLEERLFVLEPLAELDPSLVLERCGLSVTERIAELRARELAR
jgi:2-amino-4-hydroxy-6-hydroxymethyldihydropteridine diphosphokinase